MGTCTDVESLLRLAHSLDHLEDYAESEDLYRQVLEAQSASDFQRAAARRNLAYSEGIRHYATGEFSAAHACFVKALTLRPEDDEFRHDLLRSLGACVGWGDR
jgi:tetratricopeptide (TPR) repeat protein